MLKITTPNAQQVNGTSRLDTYTFSGKNGRKFFTIENDSLNVQQVTLTLTNDNVGPTGTIGGYKLYPGGTAGGAEMTIIMPPGNNMSFSVDYDNAWGDSLQATLNSDININTIGLTGATTSYVLLGPTSSPLTTIFFKSSDNETLTRRDLGSLLCQDNDGNYQISQNSLKITEDETSFGLVRTNPKLTGNVKITVDSTQNIWLNSIDAVKELSDDKYKKYRIGKNSSYASDLNRFFDLGNTPPELVFSLYQQDTQYTSTKRNFSEQYDKFYQYGVTELKSKFYDEDFSFFAPLYLKNEIPDNFVIFRTNGPVNAFSYETSFNDWKNHVTSEVLANSQIVKTYSLAEDTSIGMYLRSLVNHPSRTETDLTVSYQTNGYTYYNGISYQKGSFSQMGELLHDYYSQENPLMSVEEFITLGFERNKVISSHVLNLEFLFDDVYATDYTINRYFGMYVNAIDLAKFTISEQGLQLFSKEVNQTPFPRRGVDGNKISQKSFTQTNQDGIRVYVDTDSVERTTVINSNSFTSLVLDNYIDLLNNTLSVSLQGNYTPRLEIGDLFTLEGSAVGYNAQHVINGVHYDNNVTSVSLDFHAATGSTSLAGITSGTSLTASFYNDEKYANFIDKIFDNEFIESQPRFFYLRDNVGNLHSIDSTQTKNFGGFNTFGNQKVIELKLKDESLDISKLAGFSNLLTQTESTILDEKGRASISIEILDYFSPNDYIEISWNSPDANIGYPLRWKVIANDSMLNAGEHWPTFAIDSDIQGEYYFSYFHTGDSTVKLSKVVESIADSFNVFPFKDFDVLAKDSFLHFRSTQDGRSSETAQIKIITDIPNVKISGIPASVYSVANFIGGSERKRTRCKVRTSIAQGMLIDEYISTQGSFSLPRVYDIMGNKILFSSYLEDPIYDDLGKLIEFKGVDDFKILCIEDESSPIQLTSDGKITTYGLFKPSYGILSVMPLRDFDTDFFYSDYTKSYTPELIRYFERAYSPVKVVGITGNTYIFDKEIDPNFSASGATAIYLPYLVITDTASTPELHNEQTQFLYTGGTSASLLTASGILSVDCPVIEDTVLFLPGEKHMFFSDSELSKFKGFLTLSGVVSSQDEDTFKSLENQWDPTRFIFQNLNSEYERLEENYLKSLVLKSRVVPYISKWVSPQGKDIRDNQYRFNYHRSFGNTNFSPSAEISIPDPRYHTHEWPYLDSVPDEFPTAKYPDQMFSYMFDQLSSVYDFSSIKKDWFSDYFTVGYPCEKYLDSEGNYISANIEPSEKYSYFNYQNYDDTTQSLFRGYKIGIKELDSAGSPVNLSTKYNNYKFSVIIETREDNAYKKEEPITYSTIVNEKWKFILIKIILRVSSYRYSTGNVSYVDLYTIYNNDEIANFKYDPSLASTLKNYQQAIPEDKKLSVSVNFTSVSTNPNYLSTTGSYYFETYPFSGASYIVDLQEELKPLSTGVFSRIVGTYESGFIKSSISLEKSIESAASNSVIQLFTNQFDTIKSTIPYSSMLTLGMGGSFPWKKTILYHQGGGNSSGAGIRERLTFAEIAKVINGTSTKSKMLYEIYDVDGNASYPSKEALKFSMYTISPESLTRVYDYFPVSDTDKPQEFYTHGEIGAVLSQQKDLQTLYRYQGNFSPKFRDVLKFWVREDDTFTNVAGRDFLLNNTRIGDNFLNFSTLRNQYYSKVSDNEILKISTDSGYQPVYPLINEVVIDKKDEFAWSSSWDNMYYRKYTTTESYTDVKGTQEMKEIKSMLGSKVMKVPKQFDLYQYKITKSSKLDLSPYINDEFTYYEDSNTAYLQINVYNRLLREMTTVTNTSTGINYRAKTEFLKTLNLLPTGMEPIFDPLLIDDYVKQYLEKNILDLFQISDIKLYVLQTGNPSANSISTITPVTDHRPLIENTTSLGSIVTLDEGVLLNKGYIKQKDTHITNIGNMIFQIKYPLDSRFYTSLSVGVAVKRI